MAAQRMNGVNDRGTLLNCIYRKGCKTVIRACTDVENCPTFITFL